MTENSPESEASNSADDLKYTELTLRLPGDLPCRPELLLRSAATVTGSKRGSSSHSLDLILGQGTVDHRTKADAGCGRGKWLVAAEEEEEEASSIPKPPPAKAQLVGWPPVRASRKNIAATGPAKYVKVAVDGAPFLRKVDLQVYTSYEQLLKALGDMFSCFTIRKYINDGKLMEPVNGSEYVAAYEDKDGDWMMVGDVPWKMFVESCKRLRLMKSSDAIGLAPATPSR